MSAKKTVKQTKNVLIISASFCPNANSHALCKEVANDGGLFGHFDFGVAEDDVQLAVLGTDLVDKTHVGGDKFLFAAITGQHEESLGVIDIYSIVLHDRDFLYWINSRDKVATR